jgi:hypothetical protein
MGDGPHVEPQEIGRGAPLMTLASIVFIGRSGDATAKS